MSSIEEKPAELEAQPELQYQRRWFSFLMNKRVPPITAEEDRIQYDSKGYLSYVFFDWVFPILRIGYKRTITVHDLYYLGDDIKLDYMYQRFQGIYGRHNEAARARFLKKNKNKTPEDYNSTVFTLLLSLLDTFKWQYSYAIFAIFLCDTGNGCLPLLSRKLIQFVGERALGIETAIGKGIGYAFGIAVGLFICFMLGHHYMYFALLTGAQTKGILTKFLIEKAFKADDKSKHDFPVSKLTTFISTDLAKVDLGFQYSPLCFTFPFTLAVCIVILAIYIGYPAAVGIGVIILFTITLSILASVMVKLRIKSLVFTDKRINYIKEVVNNLKIIKFYSWEEPYEKNIGETRKHETRQLYKLQFVRNFLIATSISISSFASMSAFLVLYAADDNGRDPANVFSAVSLFGLLGYFIISIPLSVGVSADAIISLTRINAFFNSGESSVYENVSFNDDSLPSDSDPDQTVINIEKANFIWKTYEDISEEKVDGDNEDKKKAPSKLKKIFKKLKKPENIKTISEGKVSFHMKDVDLKIKKGEFIVVTGVIGSGKSSFLNAIAGFMKRESGLVEINGTILLNGTNWIQNATLRENVLFGNEYDEKKYQQVIYACGLKEDMDALPAGDRTEVGERGITLSGGQKARVNLARTIYKGYDIVLLDDVLSAVDAKVGQHIMQNCFLGLLKEKTRILATHQLSFINSADRVVFLNGDGTFDVGTSAELSSRNANFNDLIAHNHKDHGITQTKDVSNIEKAEEDKDADLDQADSSDEAKTLSKQRTGTSVKEVEKFDESGKLIEEERRAVSTIGWHIYKKYIQLGSKPLTPSIFVMIVLLTVSMSTFCQLFTNVWLSFWTELRFNQPDNFYIAIYVVITCLSLVFLILQFLCYIHLTNLASRNLNVASVKRLLGAPMSYLDTTPIGRILNRFTKDTDALDNEIVEQVRLVSFSSANIIGTILLCVIYLPWFAIAIPIIATIFTFVGSFYQASSREIKRLEAVQRSHVFNNYNESLTGMEVIKAHGNVDKFINKNDRHVDKMNEAYYMVNAVQRWLALQLNGLSFLFILLITLLCVGRVFNISPASTGLIISYILVLPNMLTMIVQSYTQLENEMNSVERMCEFAFEIPQEAPYHITETAPPQSWPHSGKVEFNNVSMVYRPGLPKTLKNVSFKVKPNERIGICGRTGAGKTSLTNALYRLVELCDGAIYIDDVDISQLGLNELRSKLSIIPQESVLFRGNIRYNLDPFGEKTDEELWKALSRSGLINASELESIKTQHKDKDLKLDLHKFHLDSVVEDDGSNFSLGERQLIAFCRALVRNSKVLILDEATSSVDYKTDNYIQKTIVKEFNTCTILCIAHRLQTILSYDRILVLDQGEVKEFDTPWNLFNDERSLFHQLCKTAKINRDDFKQ